MLRLSWSHKTGNDVVAAGKNPCMRQVESSMDVKWECKLLIDLCDMHLSNACMDAESTDDDGEMVELNGMLVSAAAAQRRQFFSSLIQRASKMKHSLGGGSLTLLLALSCSHDVGWQANHGQVQAFISRTKSQTCSSARC
jgi:hypothetical protein